MMFKAAKTFLWFFFLILDSFWRWTEGTWHEAVVRDSGAWIRPHFILLWAPGGWAIGTVSMIFLPSGFQCDLAIRRLRQDTRGQESEVGYLVPQFPSCKVSESGDISMPKYADPVRKSSPYSVGCRNCSFPHLFNPRGRNGSRRC